MAKNDEGFYLNWKIKSNDDILVYIFHKVVYKLNGAKAARGDTFEGVRWYGGGVRGEEKLMRSRLTKEMKVHCQRFRGKFETNSLFCGSAK